MATVADAARPVGAPPPPVRHGICRLTIRIHNTEYRLRPWQPRAGILAEWTLRKLGPDQVCYIVTAPKGLPATCTCPDHQESGWTCKHIGALTAAGLIPAPKPSSARGRKLHAKNARQAIAEAKALPVEARRHLAEIAPAAQALPEGWQPGGMHPSFAAGFRQAVAAHVQQLRTGEETPTGPEPDYLVCDMCDQPYEPHTGRYRDFCPECQGGVA